MVNYVVAVDVFAFVKVLNKQKLIERNQYEHTLSERKILEDIDHPFLVGLRCSFQSPTKLFMVFDFFNGMSIIFLLFLSLLLLPSPSPSSPSSHSPPPYSSPSITTMCAGGELYSYVSRGRFSEGRARFYSGEIILAIEHLHLNNIVYRDLKPENLLLDREGHIKLCDFGLCKEDVTGDTVSLFVIVTIIVIPIITAKSKSSSSSSSSSSSTLGTAGENDLWYTGVLGPRSFATQDIRKVRGLVEPRQRNFRDDCGYVFVVPTPAVSYCCVVWTGFHFSFVARKNRFDCY